MHIQFGYKTRGTEAIRSMSTDIWGGNLQLPQGLRSLLAQNLQDQCYANSSGARGRLLGLLIQHVHSHPTPFTYMDSWPQPLTIGPNLTHIQVPADTSVFYEMASFPSLHKPLTWFSNAPHLNINLSGIPHWPSLHGKLDRAPHIFCHALMEKEVNKLFSSQLA
jgi:hypothetical protein